LNNFLTHLKPYISKKKKVSNKSDMLIYGLINMIREYKPFKDLTKWIEIWIYVTKEKGRLKILICEVFLKNVRKWTICNFGVFGWCLKERKFSTAWSNINEELRFPPFLTQAYICGLVDMTSLGWTSVRSDPLHFLWKWGSTFPCLTERHVA